MHRDGVCIRGPVMPAAKRAGLYPSKFQNLGESVVEGIKIDSSPDEATLMTADEVFIRLMEMISCQL